MDIDNDDLRKSRAKNVTGDSTTALTQQRSSVYGAFAGNAEIAQRMKDLMRSTRQWSTVAPDLREGLDLIALKISRILTGEDPEYLDSWDDIAGYARCVADRIRQEEKKS
jgi:hypothetical protein